MSDASAADAATLRVVPFEPSMAEAWDAFVAGSVNGTFLHARRFLGYHRDRFTDCSLVVTDTDGTWVGVVPAALDPSDPGRVISHPGATFGGLVHGWALTGEPMVDALGAVLRHLAERGFKALAYRIVPHIYHRQPACDDVYAAFRLDGRLTRRMLSAAVDLQRPHDPHHRRVRTLRKARKSGIRIEVGSHLLPDIWPVVNLGLQDRHGARPVHSLDEIIEIARLFPGDVAVLAAFREESPVGGVVLFNGPGVTHVQYSVASAEGQQLGAMDALIDEACALARARGDRWIDFGISTNRDGRVLNAGLHRFKAEFGGGGVCYEEYTFTLAPSAGT